MNKNKFKLNFHIVKSKDKKLSEDVSIFRTTPTVNGYYLLLSSDLRGEDGTKETAVMGNLLKVTSKQTYCPILKLDDHMEVLHATPYLIQYLE